MNSTEGRIVPLARQFHRLYLNGKKTAAREVLTEAHGEAERIAIVVEALRMSAWSFAFSVWIQSWHTSDSIPTTGDADKLIRAVQGAYKGRERRGFREGATYRNRDRVRIDGRLIGEVVQAAIPGTNQIDVRVTGESEVRTIARHRIEHLSSYNAIGQRKGQ